MLLDWILPGTTACLSSGSLRQRAAHQADPVIMLTGRSGGIRTR